MKKKVSKPSKETIERRKAKAKLHKALIAEGKKAKARRDKKAKRPQVGIGSPAQEASIGNNWWERRTKHGRDKLFGDPMVLWEAAKEYFDYTINNPMGYKIEYKSTRTGLKKVRIPYTPVFTMEGLTLHLNVSTSYLRSFLSKLKKTDSNYQGFVTVIEGIRSIIYNNKFSGAANGSLNANLIAYDLKLRNDIANSASVGMNITVNNNKENDLLEKVLAKLKAVDDESGKES